MPRLLLASALALFALPLMGEEQPLPRPRPDPLLQQALDAEPAESTSTEPQVPLPVPRPEATDDGGILPGSDGSAEAAAPQPEPGDSSTDLGPGGEAEEPRPRIYQTACPALIAGQLQAEMLPPLNDGACGAQSPLSVTGVLVHGKVVPLSAPAIVNCEMASQLPEWAEAIDGYLQARENTELAAINIGTSYMCRNRNNAEDSDLSEHAFADAMDVTGFALADGRTVDVESNWGEALSSEGRLLRYAHDAACSRFTTTLGPEANELHHDHLHIDLGCHGRTCTARMCE